MIQNNIIFNFNFNVKNRLLKLPDKKSSPWLALSWSIVTLSWALSIV